MSYLSGNGLRVHTPMVFNIRNTPKRPPDKGLTQPCRSCCELHAGIFAAPQKFPVCFHQRL